MCKYSVIGGGDVMCIYTTNYVNQKKIMIVLTFVWPSANPYLSWFSSHMSLWSSITFQFAVLLNFLVAFFYPFTEVKKGTSTTVQIVIFYLSSEAERF